MTSQIVDTDIHPPIVTENTHLEEIIEKTIGYFDTVK